MNDIFENITIPVYVINLNDRPDRLNHIKLQFKDKPEFELHIIEACKNEIGAVGLWQSIVKIINEVNCMNNDIIIICEDDHNFTQYYNKTYFLKNIIYGYKMGSLLISGGIGGFKNAVPVSKNLFWIDSFWCTQFIVLFRPIFNKILNVDFLNTDTADGILSELTSHKMTFYPFISRQLDFGYSDVTETNNIHANMITEHFKTADRKMKRIYRAYKNIKCIK